MSPSSEQNVHCLFFAIQTASENKSVVLASTAIQLLDDRKSPIVAGKENLTRHGKYDI